MRLLLARKDLVGSRLRRSGSIFVAQQKRETLASALPLEVRMNWDMIGALGEIVGAAAVVVSLVYLAQQVRVSNRLARAEAWRAIATSANTLNGNWGRDPEFRRVFAQIFEGATREDVTEDDRFLIGFYLLSTAQSYDQLFREVQEGVLPPRVLDEFSGGPLFSTPYFRSSWHVFRNFIPGTLAVHMEERFDLDERRTDGDKTDA